MRNNNNKEYLMRVDTEIEVFIKQNYSGSIINFKEDTDRFMMLKRLFKKQATKNILLDSEAHRLISANQIKIILNCFPINVTNKIFVFILEPNELEVWYSYAHVLNYSDISYNTNLESIISPYFRVNDV
jgi:hypothetical protein